MPKTTEGPRREIAAVVPAAGRGLRMRPLSAAVPKEMLPFGRLPLVEHTVAELAAAGIGEICVVVGEGKESLRDYLEGRKKGFAPARLSFAFQEEPRGTGDALLQAAAAIGERPFLMALPDQLVLGERTASAQLLEAWRGEEEFLSALVELPEEEKTLFPGARHFVCRTRADGRLGVEGIDETSDAAPQGFGRTIFPPGALALMTGKYRNAASGEVDLLLTCRALLERHASYGLLLEGTPCDFGTWEGYLHYQCRFGGTESALPAGQGRGGQ